jgi:hypothetical protein
VTIICLRPCELQNARLMQPILLCFCYMHLVVARGSSSSHVRLSHYRGL